MVLVLLSACTAGSEQRITESSGGALDSNAENVTSPFFDGDTAVIEIDGEELIVAVADTGGERAQGLMDVDDLGDVDGMLFVFESARPVSFTMKNTRIPLDIWFISETGELIGTAEMEPCVTSPCTKYRSPDKVDRVLETPLGTYDFAVGDRFSTVGSG